MRQLKHLFTAAVMLFAVTACDEGTPDNTQEPPPPPLNGTVSGVVTAEGEALIGAGVSISGNGVAQVGATDGVGTFEFTGLDAGTYTITVDAVEGVTFQSSTASVTLSQGSSSGSVAFNGEYVRTSSISGTVTLAGAGAAGIGVELSGQSNAATTTGADGSYAFSGLRAGTYTVTINAPEGSDFPVTSQSVTLGTGDAEVISFDGDLPLTSTVSIKSITNSLTGATVNPNAIAGQIDVTVTVDPGTDDVQRVVLLIDDDEVGSQSFSIAAEDEAAEAPQEIVFIVVTDERGAAGSPDPRFPNQAFTMSVQVETAQGDVAAEVDQQVTFVNEDVFYLMNFAADFGPALSDQNGLAFTGDDMMVMVGFTSFSGQTVDNATFSLTGNSGPYVNDNDTWTGNTHTYTVTGFDTNATDPVDLTTGNGAQIGTAFSTDGNPIGGLPDVLAMDGIRNDVTAPAAGAFELVDMQTDGRPFLCCSQNWTNPNTDVSTGKAADTDVGGIGNMTVTYHAAAATGNTAADILATAAVDPPTPGNAGLAASVTNDVYTWYANVCDLFEHCTAVNIVASADNPANLVNGHQASGVDEVNPFNEAFTGGSSQQGDVINVVAGETFAVQGSDDIAGFRGGFEVRGTLMSLDPTNGWSCLIGSDDPATTTVVECDPTGITLATAVDNGLGADRYYEFGVSNFVDQGGLESGTLAAQRVAVDNAAPAFTAPTTPTSGGVIAGGSSPSWNSAFTDNLDADFWFARKTYLDRATALVAFPGAGIALRGPDMSLGTTFDDDLVASGTLMYTDAFFIRGIENAGTSNSADVTTNGLAQDFILADVEFNIDDVGTNRTAQATPSGQDPALVEAGSPVDNADLNLVNFASSEATIEIDGGSNPTTTNLTVAFLGTPSVLANPCTNGVWFFYRNVDGDQEMFGQVSTANMTVTDSGLANGRRWEAATTWTATGAEFGGALTVLAMCVTASGDALAVFNTETAVIP